MNGNRVRRQVAARVDPADLIAYAYPYQYPTRHRVYSAAYLFADRIGWGKWRARSPLMPRPKNEHTGYKPRKTRLQEKIACNFLQSFA
jgi:hypothetical protein